MKTGKIKMFNHERGFGFIAGDDGSPDTFLHISELHASGIRQIEEGMRLRFEVKPNARTGKPAAANVQALAAL